MKYTKEIEINPGDSVVVITEDGELSAVVKEVYSDFLLVYINEYKTTKCVTPSELR